MIDELHPYSEMKDSGVPWLREMPAHWDLRRVKVLFREKDERHRSPDGLLLSLTRARGILPHSEVSGRIASVEDLSKYKVCRTGDLVMNRMQAWSGMFAVSAYNGVISPDYSVFEPRSAVNRRYYELLFKTPEYVGQFAQRSKGIGSGFNRLYTEDFGAVAALVPPVGEQGLIVQFLDYVDRRIGRYIRAKQKLIKLLEEQKQAIIHQAVTRGLNPDAPLKPSGIPWLGNIPEHWDTPRVKHCAQKISKGTTPSTEGREILDFGPVRFLKAENISAGRITERPLCFIDEETNTVIGRSQLAQDDILFVIAGATLGKTAVISVDMLPANTNQAVAFVRPNSRVVPHFLELWLQSPRIKALIWLNAVQSAQPNLSMADLGNFVVPVPHREEQQQLLEYVQSATKPILHTISRIEREIALLREYRTRLIADVVTGKLDVREAAANLPDDDDSSPADTTDTPDDDLTDEDAANDLDPEAISEEAEVTE